MSEATCQGDRTQNHLSTYMEMDLVPNSQGPPYLGVFSLVQILWWWWQTSKLRLKSCWGEIMRQWLTERVNDPLHHRTGSSRAVYSILLSFLNERHSCDNLCCWILWSLFFTLWRSSPGFSMQSNHISLSAFSPGPPSSDQEQESLQQAEKRCVQMVQSRRELEAQVAGLEERLEEEEGAAAQLASQRQRLEAECCSLRRDLEELENTLTSVEKDKQVEGSHTHRHTSG